MQKFLIYGTNHHGHSQSYFNEIVKVILHNKSSFHSFDDKFPRYKTYAEIQAQAKLNECDAIICISLEQILSVNLLFFSLLNQFRPQSKNVPIYGFYFRYSNLLGYSFRSFAANLFLRLSPIQKIIISYPYSFNGFSRIIDKKLSFAPDYWSLSEKKSYSGSNFLSQRFSINSNQKVLLLSGYLAPRKEVELLLKLSLQNSKLLQDNNVHLLLAGKIDPLLYRQVYSLLVQLTQLGLLTQSFDYLSDVDFYNSIKCSYFTWNVQRGDSFFSSGVFTRSCAWGSLPIVSKSSMLSKICSQFQGGYSLNISDKTTCKEFADMIHLIVNNSYRLKSRANLKKYSDMCESRFFRQRMSDLLFNDISAKPPF